MSAPTNAPVNGAADGADAKAAAICSEIDHTRAQMTGTINALEERLSPARMKEQVLSQIHDAKERLKSEVREDLREMKVSIKGELDEAKRAMREATIGRVEHMVQSAKGTINETGSTVMITIRDNPIPALLTGIGLTWLVMNARSQRASRAAEVRGDGIGVRRVDAEGAIDRGERAIKEAAHTVHDKTASALHDARDAASSLVDKAGTAVHDAQERAMALTRQTRMQAQRLEESAERTMRESPLAVGAAVFALGAAVGLAIPHTRQEDQLIGAARDRLFKRAEHLAEDAIASARDRVEGIVHDMGTSGQHDQRAQRDQPLGEGPGATSQQNG
jgi:ElaB/YqjD/DUF883 family membrane-anchored ribosome-binding protein